MTVGEMYKRLAFIMQKGDSNKSVVVLLREQAIGGRASVEVKQISEGIDWECNQINIITKKPIVSDNLQRDNPLSIHILEHGKRKIYKCPKCTNTVRKADKYCSNCGQAIRR